MNYMKFEDDDELDSAFDDTFVSSAYFKYHRSLLGGRSKTLYEQAVVRKQNSDRRRALQRGVTGNETNEANAAG